MEKYLNRKTTESLEIIIEQIKSDKSYIKLQELKKEMKKDEVLKKQIAEVKDLQKKYIRSGKQVEIQKKLEDKEKELNKNTKYVEYNYHLDQVNKMIDLVKEELNDYFFKLTNGIDFYE